MSDIPHDRREPTLQERLRTDGYWSGKVSPIEAAAALDALKDEIARLREALEWVHENAGHAHRANIREVVSAALQEPR